MPICLKLCERVLTDTRELMPSSLIQFYLINFIIMRLWGVDFLFLVYGFYHFSLLLALQCQMSPDIMHWGGAGPKRPGSNICPVQEQIDLWIYYWWPWKIPKDQHLTLVCYTSLQFGNGIPKYTFDI